MEKVKAGFGAIITYLREVINELSKVAWPTKERTAKLTGVVVAMVAVLSGFMYIWDMALGYGALKFLGR